MKSIIIPASVTTIGSQCFKNCVALKTVTIMSTLTKIDEYAFQHCSQLSTIDYRGTDDVTTCSSSTVFNNASTSFEINVPPNYNSDTFCGLSITKPVVSKTGTCGSDCTYYLYDSGLLLIEGTGPMEDYTWKHSGEYYSSSPWGSLSIRDSVKRVEIRDGITTVGHYAFNRCSSITSVILGNTLTEIKGESFWGCTSMTCITVKSTTLNILGVAFFNTGLKTFVFYGSTEPKYGISSSCSCSDGTTHSSCPVFFCDTTLKNVYVPSSYAGSTSSFCGESVTLTKVDDLDQYSYC